MVSEFADMMLLSNLFDFVVFHVNMMTGSGVMTIFVFKGLNRNLEI